MAKPTPRPVVMLPSVTTPWRVYSAPRSLSSQPGWQVAVRPSSRPRRPNTLGAAQSAATRLPSAAKRRTSSQRPWCA